jgi:type IV pilus assembly protein PilY1
MKRALVAGVIGIVLGCAQYVNAAEMLDYCVTPPFIQETIKPNLLLMFDNSASVFDLAHVDKGSASRQPYYCYDQTFSNTTSYEGYFKQSAYYEYNMGTRQFVEIPAITNLTSYSCDYSDSAKKDLCVTHNGATPKVITSFRASGKYINWLTASKFDIQKKALTGGKYEAGALIAESRGCVGRGFVKEPLTTNYVEGGTNTGLGITLQVKGAPNVSNYSAPSQGGQTQFSVYFGNYNQGLCQAAVDAYANPTISNAALKKAVDDCLSSVTNTDTSSLATDQKVIFQQTIQECWQYAKSTSDPKTVGTDAVNSVTGKCGGKNGVYDKRNAGPASILPGDADQLCGLSYAGYCFKGLPADNWSVWDKMEYGSSDACIIAMHNKFCSELTVVPVTDPTDSPSITSDYSNLPAMIADLGIESQLGDALKLSNGDSVFYAKVASAAPSGLIQEFSDKIRIGGMKFNEYGSASEAGVVSPVPLTKVCSITTSQQCGWNMDCPSGETCVTAPDNKDGAHVFHYIGIGKCSVSTGTACATQANCPSGETCVADTVGTYTSGFIKKINDMKGATWTPFGEAFYNTIGYFAKDSTDTSGKKSKTSLRLNSGDYEDNRNPSEYHCQTNNVLLITDGVSTTDRHTDVKNLSDKNIAPNSSSETCSYFAGSTYLENLSWLAQNRNINTISKNTTATVAPTAKNQRIKTYVVFNGTSTGAAGDCDASVLLNKTATNGGTMMFSANSPDVFMDSLRNAFSAVAGGSASGTAASILSNSEGSGANILQAVFYPLKEFVHKISSTETIRTNATWIGEMQNLWYYVDPYIANSSVREDTVDDGTVTGVELDVKKDYVVQFVFNPDTNQTYAKLYKDSNGDGSGDTAIASGTDTRVDSTGVINADDVRSIWRAGKLLWSRNVTSSPRKLLTYMYGVTADGCAGSFSKSGLVDLVAFNWAENAVNSCILQKHLNASTQAEAENIIMYMNGVDGVTINGVTSRSRTVNIGGVSNVWKLGDIISSTPRVQSSNKLQNYHQDTPVGYADTTYANDTTGTGFANSASYKDRGMVYTGANDGMLHAFNMGKLNVQTSGDTKAILTGANLGREEWAFIPRHALSYLKYLADPNYAHQYLIDGPTKIVDASIGSTTLTGSGNYAADGCGAADTGDGVSGATIYNYWSCKRDASQTANTSWRTVLIGSMGTGGASADSTASCSASTECVKTPVNGVGFSSYYALDITDPNSPKFLWEFSDEQLGFSTTGAAVVRIAHELPTGERDTNGRWLVVIGNGPTGPIDTNTHQFKGKSFHDLRLFALDMRNGTLLKKITPETPISQAFVGSIAPGPQDINRTEKVSKSFYSDDVVYAGYTQCAASCDTAAPTWDGGVLRLVTKDVAAAVNKNSIYPKDWELTTLISGAGPVTSAVARLQDRKNKKLWLFFGTGRYFYKDDDKANQGKLVGVMEPCFAMTYPYGQSYLNTDIACKTTIDFSGGAFVNQTTLLTDPDFTNKKGWYINLEAQDTTNDYGAERVITDPVAMSNGAIFFTTFMPSTAVCNFGGNSYMWGVQYDTGGVASSNALQGKALVQVSTGSFEEVNLGAALTAEGGRKMGTPMVGKPPTDPPPIVSGAGNKALKRIIHVREK